jgi:hypothetical protein
MELKMAIKDMSVKVKTPTEFRTGKVRLSYPNIFKPVPKKDDNGNTVVDATGQPVTQYTTALIIPKTETATVEALKNAMKAAALAKFGEGKVPAKWAKGLRDGDTDEAALLDPLNPEKGRKPELAGAYWINLSSKQKPVVIGNEKDEFAGGWKALGESDIKAGDWVRAQIHCYGFDTDKNKGVAFGFSAIQFVEEGEALAGGGFDANLFEDDEELAAEFG